MRVALKFAYDGKNFYGFARQPNLKTVEGEILNLLVEKGYIINSEKSMFRYASRTDKGVSALGNVVAFNAEKPISNVFQDLNTEPDEILFYGYKIVEPNFFPRYAKQRTYRYYLKNNDYDLEKIISAANLFIGEHDFSNFARIEEGKNPARKIDNITVEEKEDFFIIDFYAETFLWNQIRRIMSAIEKILNDKINENEIIKSLNYPKKKVDFGVSSPNFLVLKDIVYDFEFIIDKKGNKNLKYFLNILFFES